MITPREGVLILLQWSVQNQQYTRGDRQAQTVQWHVCNIIRHNHGVYSGIQRVNCTPYNTQRTALRFYSIRFTIFVQVYTRRINTPRKGIDTYKSPGTVYAFLFKTTPVIVTCMYGVRSVLYTSLYHVYFLTWPLECVGLQGTLDRSMLTTLYYSFFIVSGV